MQKFVFLDIDDVLLPWDFANKASLQSQTGWDDFDDPHKKHMKLVSMEMLRYVHEKLGDYIYWLTTWEKTSSGANALFSDALEIPRYKELPNIFEAKEMNGLWLIPGTSIDAGKWWKSTVLNKFIPTIEGEYKAVWIDDEMEYEIGLHGVHQDLLDNPNIFKFTPRPLPCLSVGQIDTICDWLES